MGPLNEVFLFMVSKAQARRAAVSLPCVAPRTFLHTQGSWHKGSDLVWALVVSLLTLELSLCCPSTLLSHAL